MKRLLTASLLALVAVGCSGDRAPTPAAGAGDEGEDPRARAERAARIAKEVLDHPEDGAAVLQRHQVSPDEFSDMMYEVAGDPELAEVYETVRG